MQRDELDWVRGYDGPVWPPHPLFALKLRAALSRKGPARGEGTHNRRCACGIRPMDLQQVIPMQEVLTQSG